MGRLNEFATQVQPAGQLIAPETGLIKSSPITASHRNSSTLDDFIAASFQAPLGAARPSFISEPRSKIVAA